MSSFPGSSVPTPTTGIQFGRIANLIVASSTLVRDLSALQFRFEVRQSDLDLPNTMVVRIYNLSDATIADVTTQYTQISLQVGYAGVGLRSNALNLGGVYHSSMPTAAVEMIFSGDIKYFKIGKENATDRFLEITAGDNDRGYNYGFLQSTLGPGAKPGQVIDAAAEALDAKVDSVSAADQDLGGAMPRGKVLFGLARVYLDQVAATANAAGASWFVDSTSGTPTLKFVSTTGYLPGNAVVLTPATGLIGIPEATIDGIEGRCLINPAIRIGCELIIQPGVIVQTTTTPAQSKAIGVSDPSQNLIPGKGYETPTTVARATGKGIYRVAVIEHSGDTRGNDWYSTFTCLTIDKTAAAAGLPSVSPE
jgi:hypothetical protein